MVTIGDLENNEIESIHIEGITNIPLIKGEQGEKGDKGDKGETNNIKIGTVETGEKASATLEGESPNQILNLVLPKGDKGEQGEPGIKPVKGIDYFTEEEIQEIKSNILDQVNQFSVLVVEELPTDNIDEHTIYFVPKTKTEQNDVYDEFIYINNGWEHIGTTEVDLSSYYKKDEIDTKLEAVEGNEVFVGNEKEAPSSAKIIVEEDDFVEGSTLSKAEVYVGAEEPVAGEKVWFRKGKNLLNIKSNYSVTSNGLTFSYNSTTKKFRCQGTLTGTNFYLMLKNIYDMGLDLYETEDYTMSIDKDIPANVLLKSGTEEMSAITCLETGDKSAQIVNKDKKADTIYLYANSATNGTVYDFEFGIQIEQSSKATSYETYIEPQIFVRNSNGVYEEFIKKSEEVYSSEETVIGTWLGKPLYRKTINVGTLPNNTVLRVAHNIINYDRFVNIIGSAKSSTQSLSFPFVGSNLSDNIAIQITTDNIVIITGSDRSAFNGYVTLEYTKTTD